MNKFMKGRNVTLYLYLAIALVMACVWRLGEYITAQKLSTIPISKLKAHAAKPTAVDLKSFYPVFVKQPDALKAERAAADPAGVDALFSKPEDDKPVVEAPAAPVEPDYVAIIKQSAVVEAVSDNGAVINGRFYAVGEKIGEMMFVPAGKAAVVPVVAAVNRNIVDLRVGKAMISIAMNKPVN